MAAPIVFKRFVYIDEMYIFILVQNVVYNVDFTFIMLRIYSVIMLMLQCYACIQLSVSMHNLYFSLFYYY